MPSGLKHLIKCRCTLPQYKRLANSPAHQFIVFSVIDDDDRVVPKFVQCNNCAIVHKVIEINKSEIVPRESLSSTLTVDDIRPSIPEQLATILDTNKADLPSWEAARFIIENKKWDEFVVISCDVEDGFKQGKYVRILGERLFKVETFMKEINK